MILQLLFFVVVVYVLILQIKDLRRPASAKAVTHSEKPAQLKSLEEYAGRLYAERQYLPAEKAYLKILKINHRDQLAYSRLGMIYVALKNYDDAIECFQIAAQLKPSAAAWYNLGLAYYQNNNAIKSIAAIEKAIMFAPSAERYLGLAKAYAKITNNSKSIWALERSVELERSKKTLAQLGAAYIKNHDREKAVEIYKELLELDPSDTNAKRIVGAATPATGESTGLAA